MIKSWKFMLLLTVMSFLIGVVLDLWALIYEAGSFSYLLLHTVSILFVIWPYVFWIYVPVKLANQRSPDRVFFRNFMLVSGLFVAIVIGSLLLLQLKSNNYSSVANMMGFLAFLNFLLMLFYSGRALRNFTENQKHPASVLATMVSLFYMPIGVFYIYNKLKP